MENGIMSMYEKVLNSGGPEGLAPAEITQYYENPLDHYLTVDTYGQGEDYVPADTSGSTGDPKESLRAFAAEKKANSKKFQEKAYETNMEDRTNRSGF